MLSRIPRFFVDRLILLLLLVSACVNAYFLYQYKGNIKGFGKSFFHEMGLRREATKELTQYSARNDAPIVYYAFLNNVELVPGSAIQEDTSELPESLIIPPGKYIFYNREYKLEREGLYRFVYPRKENKQRIVFVGNLDSLLSAIAWIHSHGNSDNNKSFTEISNKALHSKIFLTCGRISSWAQKLLENNGVKVRIVSTLTLDSWNTYNNGHTLIEIWRNDYGKWVAYDLDNNTYLIHDKKPLNLIEFANKVASKDYDIRYLASDIRLDISNFAESLGSFDYALLSECRLANESTLKQWYKRVIQVPMILDGDSYYFFDVADRARIICYSKRYKYIDELQFMERFYH